METLEEISEGVNNCGLGVIFEFGEIEKVPKLVRRQEANFSLR